jgi:acyl-CoA thioester hydrolase
MTPTHNSLDASGWIAEGAHHFPLRVYFDDTDGAGVVYHANYLRMTERARTELLRLLGAAHLELIEQHGLVFVVRSAAVEYLSPARLDEHLVVESRLDRLGGASLSVAHRIMRGHTPVVTMAIGLVCMRLATGKPERIPERWRAALAPVVAQLPASPTAQAPTPAEAAPGSAD